MSIGGDRLFSWLLVGAKLPLPGGLHKAIQNEMPLLEVGDQW